MIDKIKKAWEASKRLGPLAPLMLFSVLAPALGALVLLATVDVWLPLFESSPNLKFPLYFCSAIFLAGLSLIPTHASSLIAGMLFGIVKAPFLALLAVVGASYLSFVIITMLVQEKSYQLLLKKPRAAKIHEELLLKNGYKAVLFIALIRLSPVMPFAATNVLLAAAKVKASLFLVGSLIGLAPRVVLVAIAGAGLAELDLSKSSNIWLGILGAVSTVFLLVYIGKVVQKVSRNF